MYPVLRININTSNQMDVSGLRHLYRKKIL